MVKQGKPQTSLYYHAIWKGNDSIGILCNKPDQFDMSDSYDFEVGWDGVIFIIGLFAYNENDDIKYTGHLISGDSGEGTIYLYNSLNSAIFTTKDFTNPDEYVIYKI